MKTELTKSVFTILKLNQTLSLLEIKPIWLVLVGLGWIGSISFLVFIYTPSIHTHGCGAKFLITCPKCRYDNFD